MHCPLLLDRLQGAIGKDFVAGFIAVSFFIRPMMYFDPEYVRQVESQRSESFPHPHTRRVVTTSVAEHHLKVLWGEIGRFITTSSVPLTLDKGGPLTVNYQEVRLAREKDSKNPLNYLVGRVSAKGEGLAGHHAAYTLCICDEASGVDDVVYEMQQGWAKRLLAFGNPNQTQNWWRKGIKAGDLKASA